MKRLTVALTLCCSILANISIQAADKTSAEDEFKALFEQINAKLKDGKRTEMDLADELKRFDDIVAAHKDEKTDEIAQIVFMKAMLYLQVFENTEKGKEIITSLKRDYPNTQRGKTVDDVIAQIDKQEAAKKIARSLVVGAEFPDFAETDLDGKPLSLKQFRGNVVLVDFWATWCGPCIVELPNVLDAYKKYHAKGFDIVGISLDEDKAKLTGFIKDKDMPWPQFFDGLGWKNKLAEKYGVNSIPATYLLDKDGKIHAKDLRGPELSKTVAALLDKVLP